MAKYNSEWATAIKALLDSEGLTARAAERKVGGTPTHGYISQMLAGKVPEYATAVSFLGQFERRDLAIACLEAVGYPVPKEWQDGEQPNDLIRRYVRARRGVESREQIEASIRKILDEEFQE